MPTSKLFDPYKLGAITLSNRAVMAPLTRNRALAGMVPNPLAIDYYGQRASAGFSSRRPVRFRSKARAIRTPPVSIPRSRSRAGKKSRIASMSAADISSSSSGMSAASRMSTCRRTDKAPVAPSAIRAKGKTFVGGTFADVSEPRALELAEIPGIIEASSAARPMRSKPGSTASKFTAPTATCSISSPRTVPTSAPMPTAARSRTAQS